MDGSSTKLYNVLMGNSANNAIGRTTGMQIANQQNPNFFQKRWNSLENAIGTSLAALPSLLYDKSEQANTDIMLDRHRDSLNDVYKKYGYNNADDYYTAKDAAENDIFGKYGYNSQDFWDKRSQADLNGDQATVEQLEKERQDIIAKMDQQDADRINYFENIQNELKNQAKTNLDEASNRAKAYEDYRKNNYVSQKINQDPYKFAGSAINTESTLFDLLSMGAGIPNGVITNSFQGGIEGIADELEQNGSDYDVNRALQNAAIGMASGAATGLANKGLNNILAKNGGNLFKGSNALTRGLNNLGSNTGLGRVASTIATGAGRGAVSGAVGGATGAGLSAAMNNQDVLGSALQGAAQGATSGAMTGAAMSGANLAANTVLNKLTPNIANAVRENQARNAAYGDNTIDQFKGAWNSGDSAVAEKILKPVVNNVDNFVDSTRTRIVNRNAIGRLTSALDGAMNGGTKGNTKFVRLGSDLLDDLNNIRVENGLDPLTNRQVTAYENAINNNLINRAKEGMSTSDVALMAFNALTSDNSKAVPGYYNNQLVVSEPGMVNDYDGTVLGLAEDGGTSLKSIEPRNKSQIEMFEENGQQKMGPRSQLGSSPVEEQPVNNSIVSQNNQNVNSWDRIAHEGGYASYDDAIRAFAQANPNAEVNAGAVLTWMDNNPGDWNPNVTRTAVENVQPEAEAQPELRYGESQLGNRTKRGMIADSIERFGDTLEGAQTNVTRAAAKDLGIESTGKVVENVRKKTGITNLETQAAFAKELTGGSDSLLDNIQRNALSTDENGRPYTVDTTALSRDIDSIVNQYADTNVFGSQSAREKFIRNLKTDISSYDSDVLSIANRMKATASDLRGKGVGEVPAKDKAMAKIYTEVANRLDDLSYKSIPQKNVNRMFNDAITEMRGRATQADANGNTDIAKAYTRAADNLAKQPRTIKAFRTFKKDFVDASKIANLTALAENGAAVQMGRGFGSGLKRFTGALLQRPVNTALAKIGGAANSIADRIAGDGAAVTSTPVATNTAYNPATQVYNAIGRNEGLTNGEQARTANYLVNAVQEANTVPKAPNAGAVVASDIAPTPNSSTNVYNSIYGTPITTVAQTSRNTGYFQPTGDYWTDILASAVSTAIDNNDETAFASLYEMYQDALSKTQANNTSTSQKLSATQQRANAAMNSLERLSSMTPDLAYNLSNIPVIGGLATFGGNDYEAEAKSLAQQIGYMVSGSNIRDSEAEAIGKSYVPQPWDNEQVRKNKLRRAYEIISQYQNGYVE